MCKNEKIKNACYLAPNAEDELWGITITTVGNQIVNKNEYYPPQNHPEEYLFKQDKGRILNEYQLLYITNGNGILTYGQNKQTCIIDEGKMVLLVPGMWHSYTPLEKSGWNEYWIGFKGSIIQNIADKGLLANRPPVFSIGLNEGIVDLYRKALEIATQKRTNFQNVLGGIVLHMLGLMFYQDKNQKPNDLDLKNKIDKAKIIMRESVYQNICPEDIAKKLNISYSGFRRAFKEHTGTSPLRHILDLKLDEAKLLLINSSQSVKQISYTLNFESPDYFNVFFKKRTGQTPNEYREECLANITKPVFEIGKKTNTLMFNLNNLQSV